LKENEESFDYLFFNIYVYILIIFINRYFYKILEHTLYNSLRYCKLNKLKGEKKVNKKKFVTYAITLIIAGLMISISGAAMFQNSLEIH